MKCLLPLFCLFAVTLAAPKGLDPEVEIPFPVCSRSSNKLNECVRDTVNLIIPQLSEGFPTLGIHSYDPFVAPKATYELRQADIAGVLHTKNSTAVGLSKSKVTGARVKFTDTDCKIELDFEIPTVLLEGKYKGEGRFNGVKVNSKGYFNISMTDVKATWLIIGKTEDRDGETYMKITKFDMAPEVGNMKLFATGLFPDPDINRIALEFVNQYWEPMYKVMMPGARQSWEPLMLQELNEIFSKIPYRRLVTKD